MKSITTFIKESYNSVSKKNIDMFNKAILKVISENNIDTEAIKKLIKNYDYDTETVFYNLEFPTSWKSNKKAYSDLKTLIDGINEIFNDDAEYKNIDWNDFWAYFKENIFDLLN